ncbi:MAG: hypothetical protein QOD69_3551 [Solirubrobacteraceae bacterium]|jgi:hypothetical protein|nr:hypothetical protein [Solirubrobacteraceae bacterium]
MGRRSRKRGRTARSGGAVAPQAPAPAPPPPPPPADEQLRRGYARGRARDDAIRAELEPLAPGERPAVVTFAAGVAFVFAAGNVITALTGNDIAGASGDPVVTTAVTTALLLMAGIGMLARQYWAVLGFQTILGLQIVFLSLYLIGVQKWWQALVCIVAIGLMGWLFWKLVRPMARLQMPDRPTR